MSHLLRTTLPTVKDNLNPSTINQEELRGKNDSCKQRYADNYSKRHKAITMPRLNPGDSGFIRDQGCHDKVLDKLVELRSYKVSLDSGNIVRRNQKSVIHTDLDNQSSSPTKCLTPKKEVAESPNKVTSESSKTEPWSFPPSAPTPNPAKLSVEQPGSNDFANQQTTRLGRVIKCTRQPEMVFYK